MSGRERTYAGSTLSARRAQRRAELVEAALDLVGEGGSPAVTVRSVCRRAGLTDRYFYESFANRDELLVTVFGEVLGQALETTSRVVDQVEGQPRDRARAAVRALLTFMQDDPRKGRLIFREPFSDSALIAAGMVGATGLTRILAHTFPQPGSGARRAMTAIAQGGALATVLATYQLGTLHVRDEELVEFCAEIIAPNR